jgi:hypothetical protein
MSVGKTIKGYFWWTYPRGSFHYDVMVTLILAFIFLAPRWINFNDKPPGRPAHPTAVLVQPDGEHGFIYQLDASAIDATEDKAIRRQLKGVIEPFSGAMVIDHYVLAGDTAHPAYRVWVHR